MVEKVEKSKRFERMEVAESEPLSLRDEKIKAIQDSKMPESQKNAYLKEMGVVVEAVQEGVPFSVFAKIKNIPGTMHKAMMVYPKVKGVRLASVQKWEELLKDF